MYFLCNNCFYFLLLLLPQISTKHQGPFGWFQPWDGAQGDPWSSKGASYLFSKRKRRQQTRHPNLPAVSASQTGSASSATHPCQTLRSWSFPKQQTFRASSAPSPLKAKTVEFRVRASLFFWARTAPRIKLGLFVILLEEKRFLHRSYPKNQPQTHRNPMARLK